jgi:hypothetical protein
MRKRKYVEAQTRNRNGCLKQTHKHPLKPFIASYLHSGVVLGVDDTVGPGTVMMCVCVCVCKRMDEMMMAWRHYHDSNTP